MLWSVTQYRDPGVTVSSCTVIIMVVVMSIFVLGQPERWSVITAEIIPIKAVYV